MCAGLSTQPQPIPRTGWVDNPSQSTRCDNSRNKNRVDNTSLSYFVVINANFDNGSEDAFR